MENLGNSAEQGAAEAQAVAVKAAEAPEEGAKKAEQIANSLEKVAEQASDAAKDATNHSEHEVLSGVSSALELLRAELKRANDLREFEQRQAEKVTEQASDQAQEPIAQVIDDTPPRRVRRGARKVKR
jgi:hypothetical protein